jgi:hypothetical protein
MVNKNIIKVQTMASASGRFDEFISALVGGLNALSVEINDEADSVGSNPFESSSASTKTFKSYMDILTMPMDDAPSQSDLQPTDAPQPPSAPEFEARKSMLLHRWQEWNKPDLFSREEVDAFLEDRRDGAFVVRPSSSKESNIVLCVKFAGIIINYLLERYISLTCTNLLELEMSQTV